MAHVKHRRTHKKVKNNNRRNGKAWKQGLPPEQRKGKR